MDILLRTIVDTDHHSSAVSDYLGPVQLLHLLHLLQPCQGELRAPLRLGHVCQRDPSQVPAARPEICGDVPVHQPDGLVPLPHRGLGRLLRVHHRPGRGGCRVQRLAAAAHLPVCRQPLLFTVLGTSLQQFSRSSRYGGDKQEVVHLPNRLEEHLRILRYSRQPRRSGLLLVLELLNLLLSECL